MSYARRTDNRQKAIVAALRANGRYVIVTSHIPEFIDLVVWSPKNGGTWHLAEVKSPGGKLTEGQRALMLLHPPVHLWYTPEQALEETE